MSKSVWARPSTIAEIAGQEFDEKLAGYRNLQFVTAAIAGEPIAMLPYHSAVVLEAPKIIGNQSDEDIARALHEMVHYGVTVAFEQHFDEVHFYCEDVRLCALASKHGFEVEITEQRGMLTRQLLVLRLGTL